MQTPKTANLFQTFHSDLVSMDPKYGSILTQSKKMQMSSKSINNKLKKKCMQLIAKDLSIQLIIFMEEQHIEISQEISKQGYGWNILHYIAKANSGKCMNYCLRWLYQTQPTNYSQTINIQTSDGDTPLMIACIHKSNTVIKTLLNYGGLNLSLKNTKKQTAYQIILHSINQQALSIFIKYQSKIKNKPYLNQKLLNQPIILYNNSNIFVKFYTCLFTCFYLHQNIKQLQINYFDKNKQTQRNIVNNINQSVLNFDISWTNYQNIYGKYLPLFSSTTHPFSIKQSNIIVSNLLIVFQVLGQHSSLLKKIISTTNNNKYHVKIIQKYKQHIITIDNLFPFFTQTNQPVFLSLADQLWPMVLQKAIYIYYHGIFQSAKIAVEQLIYTISGNQMYTLHFSDDFNYNHSQIISKLSKLQIRNSIIILKPKQSCPLKAEQGRIQCFSLLKMTQQNFLVNCPFILGDEQKRAEGYSQQMKVQMSHYHNSSCTSVWLNQKQFFSYFSEAIFCDVIDWDLVKNSLVNVTVTNRRMYLVLKIKQKSESNTFYISFRNQQQGKYWSACKCLGWSIAGQNRQKIQKISCQIFGHIQVTVGKSPCQLLILCQFDQKTLPEQSKQTTTIIQTNQPIDSKPLDSMLGDLQFIECCKKYFNTCYKKYNLPIIQNIGNFLLIMVNSINICYIQLIDNLSQDNIVQGIIRKDLNKIQMFQFQNIYFLVLANVDQDVNNNIQIMCYDEEYNNSTDMEGGTSTN